MNQFWTLFGFAGIFAILCTNTRAAPVSEAQVIGNRSISAFKNQEHLEEPPEITQYRIHACADCKQYEDNHCATLTVVELEGIGCPEGGAEACRICQELDRIRHIQNADIYEEEDHTEDHHLVKRACLPYGADCSGGFCCRNLGLKCVTNSEGRGRNHNFCRNHDGV